jgi:hypothetical protein
MGGFACFKFVCQEQRAPIQVGPFFDLRVGTHTRGHTHTCLGTASGHEAQKLTPLLMPKALSRNGPELEGMRRLHHGIG